MVTGAWAKINRALLCLWIYVPRRSKCCRAKKWFGHKGTGESPSQRRSGAYLTWMAAREGGKVSFLPPSFLHLLVALSIAAIRVPGTTYLYLPPPFPRLPSIAIVLKRGATWN